MRSVLQAPHIVHTPLQVPQRFIDMFAFMEATDLPRHPRQFYHAMVHFADEALANITAAYERKGMYDDLLIVFRPVLLQPLITKQMFLVAVAGEQPTGAYHCSHHPISD